MKTGDAVPMVLAIVINGAAKMLGDARVTVLNDRQKAIEELEEVEKIIREVVEQLRNQ